MVIPAIYNFAFQAQELPQKLNHATQDLLEGTHTGYWLCEFPAAPKNSQVNPLYIALLEGRVVFSGKQQFSWPSLLETLQRYIPRLRHSSVRQTILTLERKLTSTQHNAKRIIIPRLLNELRKLSLVEQSEITQALRLKILSDLDLCLFDCSGQAQFLPSPQLHVESPIPGFELESLLSDVQKRQALWHKLQAQIPSMDSVPTLNTEAVSRSNLSIEQKRRLENLVLHGKTLNEIAETLAQDSLEIAKGFAKLVNEGLVTLDTSTAAIVPEIVIVDDSPIILNQFKRLVTTWGYQVKLSQNPATALKTILYSNPAIIFLDINMPEITGFDLVKQIRRQPKLASVPLVMLTAEKTLSNNWRAQWGGCKFLSKPVVMQEVPRFQVELRELLGELAPLQASNQVETHLVQEK
ncbi:response regulator [Oculatella sp. FACHB-28]|uniref:response regulator n=1 Tax=Oculatella sp. FACHB-28 TaxID=2692845 RepID=UPI0016873A86|nr:response regulator [Oculatella sp. FACHB-28]MBD2056683.1 response regulator [Oculatella sp. FACHB-28]